MIVTYDNEVDAIYFKLSNHKIHSTEAETDRLIIDYDKEDKIVGIEVLDFQYLVGKGLKVDDLPFTKDQLSTAIQYFNIPMVV